METLKKIAGFALLPFAFILWIFDRFVSIITPQNDHPNFAIWLNNKIVMTALIRLVMLVVLRYLVFWSFGI